MHIPFSVYLGWISVATIANVTTLLVHWGWTGGPLREATWAAFLVGIAMGLGLYMVRTRRDFAYALVIIWAFVGIILKRNAVDVEPWTLVPLTAALGIAALVIRMVGTLVKRPA